MKEALKLALEALQGYRTSVIKFGLTFAHGDKAITAIKEALAQPEQEPVGLIESLKIAQPCCGEYETCWRPCTPRGKFLGQRDAQRTWVGLTDEEIMDMYNEPRSDAEMIAFGREVEAKLKEKNT